MLYGLLQEDPCELNAIGTIFSDLHGKFMDLHLGYCLKYT